MHSNVMLCFMVQALQDLPLSSSTSLTAVSRASRSASRAMSCECQLYPQQPPVASPAEGEMANNDDLCYHYPPAAAESVFGETF
jgi:hypothetical protein